MLKEYYGIGENEPLYILKIDADVAGKEGATIEYEVYYPFNGKNLNQLDLSICEGVDITIGYPMDISGENLDLYDRNSGFYNDICYPYTNENGTDVILEDRQKEFAENNRSLCEENCEFLGNDDTTGRVECSCEIKFGLSLISEIKIDKDKLYKFMDITNIANFNVMKCIKLLFSKEGMLTNIGFYTTFPLLIAYFVCIVYFNKKEYKLIIIQIEEIVLAKKGLIRQEKKKKKKVKPHIFKTYVVDKDIKLEGNKNDNINNEIESKKENKIKNNNIIKNINNNKKFNNYLIKSKNSIIKEEENENSSDDGNVKFSPVTVNQINIKSAPKAPKGNNSSPPKKKFFNKKEGDDKKDIIEINEKSQTEPQSKNLILFEKYKNSKNKDEKEELKRLIKEKIKEILAYIDVELNELGYKKAFKFDHRTYKQYYLSLLKTKHIFFQIFDKKDYNSISIKILLLFFNFTSCYAVNALFFNDETMHKILEDGGNFNFIYQLPQIVYSTIISAIIDFATSSLALSQDDVLDIKRHKNISSIDGKAKRTKKMLRVKTIFFFITNFLFILLFWYYLGCFCAVYKNTQYHLIKDTLISYGIGIITPFGTFLIPGIFRIPSLKEFTQGRKKMYKLSKLVQRFL